MVIIKNEISAGRNEQEEVIHLEKIANIKQIAKNELNNRLGNTGGNGGATRQMQNGFASLSPEMQVVCLVMLLNTVPVKKKKKNFLVMLWAVITIKKIKGKLGIKANTDDGAFLDKSEAIAEALTLDTNGFYLPVFSGLANLIIQNGNLNIAMRNVAMRTFGAGAAKKTIKDATYANLQDALAYINAKAKLDQTNAAEIITGCLMQVAGTPSSNKQEFSVKQQLLTCNVLLRCFAAMIGLKYVKATYYWRFSQTPAEPKVWTDIDASADANTMVEAGVIPAGARTWFEKCYKTKKGGKTAWFRSQSIFLQAPE
jgi:hypothetical protein